MKLKIRAVHKFMSAALAVCLLAAALPTQAFAVVAEYETYQTENGGFLRINRFTNTLDSAVKISGDLVIPSTVGTAKVEAISDGVFYECDKLTSVVVPSSVQSIGDRAFMNCTELKSVKLNEGLVSLGKDAFRNCYGLTDVSLPSTLKAIESATFASCLALQSITVPSGVKSIGTYAFDTCKTLTSVSLPDGITAIGDYAFSDCNALTSIDLPESLTGISIAMFSGCTSLASVNISGNVVNVGQSAFGGCTSLTKVVLPQGVQRIEQWAFNGCSALTVLSVPDSVSTISADALNGCDNVTLYVNAGTLAQVFASANKIPFKIGTLDGSGSGNHNQEQYPETPFNDVKDHWAKSYIEWAYAKKYFSGMTETSFLPNAPVNRGMLVSVLYRMEGKPDVGNSSFTDVKSGAYYAKAVAWAESSKVVSGMEPGKFMPARNITREQLAAMLFRYAKYKGLDTSARGDLSGFKDVSQISAFAGTSMAWAVGEGIVNGVTATTLNPKGTATRAQAAVMLKKFSELK